MDDSASRFTRHFQVPKKEINRIKKEFKESQEVKDKQDPQKLKDFENLSNQIFDFYEEISGRSVNRSLLISNIVYWFDEGFDVPEMQNHIRSQRSNPYMQQNPEKFTVANLFPTKDQDRIIITWDLLSFELSKLEVKDGKKEAKLSTLQMIRRQCGHPDSVAAFRDGEVCKQCVLDGSEIECLTDPYSIYNHTEDSELKALAYHFMRQNEESLTEYAIRTHPMRSEVCARNNVKIASIEAMTGILEAAAFG